MADLIERKRRRRRKIDSMSFSASRQWQLQQQQQQQLQPSCSPKLQVIPHSCLMRDPSSRRAAAEESGHKCESPQQQQNGSKQTSRLHSNNTEPRSSSLLLSSSSSSSQQATSHCRSSSAIHSFGQPSATRSWPSRCPPPMSLPLLLLISVAFALALSSLMPQSKNLILLTEASANNNPQQQPSQYGGNSFGGGGGGNTVIGGKARYKTMYACEDRLLTMDCDYGSKINLIRANYGRFSITQCNEQGQLDLSTDCMSPITFRIMRERCQDKQKCSVNASSAIFGDKCPKTRKYLEVHFQCQPDQRQQQQQPLQQQTNSYINNIHNDQPDRVDLRNSSQMLTQIAPIIYPGPTSSGTGTILPPNNPTTTTTINSHQQQPPAPQARPSPADSDRLPTTHDEFLLPVQPQPQSQQYMPVMNSDILDYSAAANANNITTADDQIIVTLRHSHTENMSNPRCVSWDHLNKQWTPRGSRIVDTNMTHTICAFDRPTSYLLVMDYHSAPNPTISPINQPISLPPVPNIGPPDQKFLDSQPAILSEIQQPQDANKMSSSSTTAATNANSSSLVRFFSVFGYLLAIVFVAIAFITIAFIASTMRTSGTTLKSLGNFTAFGGPKYKNRRADEGLHNKDLLVINNQNGHQFLYAPASTTKISSPTSTHILPGGLANQGTLHHHMQQQQMQQQQMYSGNGTLSNLSGTGGQSNYYYGLMGSIFQQQQQQQQQQQSQLQHHLSTHHLNQQHQLQQGLQAANYQHQANKSTISNESANSTPSSSGVESASTSIHQQQQQQQQQPQSCLMMNSDYNLMGQQVNNYNQTLLSNHLFQHQPQLTLNAHYSSSGPMPSMNASQQQQQQQQQRLMMNNSSQLMREHIYESVDDDKQLCMSRNGLLDPSEQLFNSNTLSQMSQANSQQANLNRAMTLSSRLLQNAIQQQQQQQQQQSLINSSQTNKRLVSHPAIVRDNQTKTNIICSKLAQVTPQRATEINKFQHDMMAIFNVNDTTTTTTTAATATPVVGTPSNGACFGRTDGQLVNDLGVSGGNSKVSTDC